MINIIRNISRGFPKYTGCGATPINLYDNAEKYKQLIFDEKHLFIDEQIN